MRHRSWIVWSLALVLLAFVAGCGAKQQASQTMADSTAFATNPTEQGQGAVSPEGQAPPPPAGQPPAPAPEKRSTAPTSTRPKPAPAATKPAAAPGITVPSGTALAITLNSQISSETANVGDAWSGVVKDNVVVDGKTVIPSGSVVTGTVSAAKPAVKGDRAMLDLAVTGITVEGHEYKVGATTEAVVAGSPRARNLGAVAGGAAAGALIGKAVGGSGKGALIGGLIGGAAAGAGGAASKGYQVVLKEGTEITFNTKESVKIQR